MSDREGLCWFCDNELVGKYDRIPYCEEHWFHAEMAKG
jgi:hypothetical protein